MTPEATKGGSGREEFKRGVGVPLPAPGVSCEEGVRAAGPLDVLKRPAVLEGPLKVFACGEHTEGAMVNLAEPLPSLGSVVSRNSEQPAMAGGIFLHEEETQVDTKLSFAGMKFSQMGSHLLDALQCCIDESHCKTLSTAKDFMFPLPLRGYPGVDPEKEPWLSAVLLGAPGFDVFG